MSFFSNFSIPGLKSRISKYFIQQYFGTYLKDNLSVDQLSLNFQEGTLIINGGLVLDALVSLNKLLLAQTHFILAFQGHAIISMFVVVVGTQY